MKIEEMRAMLEESLPRKRYEKMKPPRTIPTACGKIIAWVLTLKSVTTTV